MVGNTRKARTKAYDGIINLLPQYLRYFIGVPPDAPSQRHLYSVPGGAPLARSPAVPHCLTCDLTLGDDNSTATDTTCLWNAATVSPAFGHFVLECLGPDVPSVFLVALNLEDNNGTDGGGRAVRLLERIRNGNFGNIFRAKSNNNS